MTATGMAKKRRIKLGILFGGKSGEHEVSLASAASVMSALDPEKFEISAFGITRTGKLATTVETRKMLPAHLHKRVGLAGYSEGRNSNIRLLSVIPWRQREKNTPDIIFPLLHGPYGEDGTIQGLLETAGIPYIGCGVLASAVSMDKDVMKRLFLQARLPTLPFIVVSSADLMARMQSLKKYVRKHLSYPVFTKPANLGSSVGVCKVHSEKELADAARFSSGFDRKILIEKGVQARELECALLGNDTPIASIVGEVVPSHEFYDYEAKYHDPASRLEIPARISHEQSEKIRKMAIRAFQVVEGSGLARVDFFMDKNTSQVWVNEINTMPGFTPISMYAKLWTASGILFENLVRELIRLGLERHKDRASFRVSHDDEALN